MMATARLTPPDDFDRLAENIQFRFGDVIEDRSTFDVALGEFFVGNPRARSNADINPKAFRAYVDRNPSVSLNREHGRAKALHIVGSGRSLEADQRQTAKTVLPDTVAGRSQYIERGASKVDLKGVDTKKKAPVRFRERRDPKLFKFVGKQKGRTVFSRRIRATFKTKTGTVTKFVFIDRKGRRVSVKKK